MDKKTGSSVKCIHIHICAMYIDMYIIHVYEICVNTYMMHLYIYVYVNTYVHDMYVYIYIYTLLKGFPQPSHRGPGLKAGSAEPRQLSDLASLGQVAQDLEGPGKKKVVGPC